MMAKQAGEMHPRHAARLLGVSVKTVREWAKRRLRGEDGRQLKYARRDPANKIFVQASEILSIRDNGWGIDDALSRDK